MLKKSFHVTRLRLVTWKDFSSIHDYDFARKTSYREVLLTGLLHCWNILLILVLGKVASKTQYSHFVICKVWVLGFTHHFTLHPLIWQIFSLISWLYFSTMWILWGRKCDYWVFHITHAKKGLPNHSSSTRDLKDFFSICDVENTILTYPPHSILSFL